MKNTMGSNGHYERGNLIERLKAALVTAGFDDEKMPLHKDLEPLDQYHSRGLEATIELAQALNINNSMHVLDIGSGLGGPSRYLAEKFGCKVSGIDLSESFVDAANFLAEKTGMADRVTYRCANALSLPFDSSTFDVVWTQHVAMNISNRVGLYMEAFRVLRSGGKLAIFDVVVASNEPPKYPLPWAMGPETSFLVTANQMHDLLLDQGFKILTWTDSTKAGIDWFTERQREGKQKTASMLGLHIIMGPSFPEMTSNLARNLSEGRLALIQTIVEK